jgi:DNA-binding transcriptional MerR regulator
MVFIRKDSKEDLEALAELERLAKKGVSDSELEELIEDVEESEKEKSESKFGGNKITKREYEIKKSRAAITEGSVKKNSFRRG